MPERNEDPGGWGEYRRQVMGELDRINDALVSLNAKLDALYAKDISELRVSVAMLQVKSGIWGALAGLVVALSAVALKMLAR